MIRLNFENKFLNNLKTKRINNTTLSFVVARIVRELAKKNIKSGKDVNEKPFKRLKKSTIKQKERKHCDTPKKPLICTKSLLNSITARRDKVYANEYGIFHNWGTKLIPRRTFIPYRANQRQVDEIKYETLLVIQEYLDMNFDEIKINNRSRFTNKKPLTQARYRG